MEFDWVSLVTGILTFVKQLINVLASMFGW